MDSRSPSKFPPSEVALDEGMRKMDATPPASPPIDADTAAFGITPEVAALATPSMLLRFAGGNPALGNGILLCRSPAAAWEDGRPPPRGASALSGGPTSIIAMNSSSALVEGSEGNPGMPGLVPAYDGWVSTYMPELLITGVRSEINCP